ncbi:MULTISPECIES: transcription antitermination factor NusB [unclassified Corynebacterium]|uniref:transcription antitermination factor NusB n=1 Tax=unclassified Corynebacterium TaxID=2624378 RepID=UPI0003B8BEAA|nr:MULTISPECIES: transcription antitermination factor NusB [unclassified Corynebacterium]ERS47630.1 transcription antitermination factor NusB [Corynebacterium sp. KPL1860]ERS57255.1 transcription antitermination factor NusB [Corynebacterium sp. KPL1821]ERS77046.1 transcription antitermination factor NusB [Corynebacterium sp. KPL1857]
MSDNTPKRDTNYKRHTARYRARRRAADILYEAENRDIDPVAIVEDRIALAREDRNAVAPIAEYTKVIIKGAAEELDVIDETISRYLSEDWELHRIPAVDRAILRVSVWELLFNPDIPTATAVVEGVEIASQYSNEQAAPYIHAVLDDVAQSRSAESPMSAEHQGLEEDGHDTAAAEDTTDAVSPAESAETASNTAATDEASAPAEDSAQ